MRAAITSEARIHRFNEWLQAKSTPQKAAGLKPGSNLLLATALHGLARRSKGHELTEIEKWASGPFAAMAESEEELNTNTLGQICCEAKSAVRSRSFAAFNAPAGIMGLSEDDPVSRDQFNEHVRKHGVETVQQPHIRVVRADAVGPDGSIPETEEFASATSSLGRGLTMFIEPESETSNQTQTNWTYYLKLQASIFKCYRRSNEWGKDEVYFTWGFGNDSRGQNHHRTPEFGSVVTGTVRNFPSNTILNEGWISKCMVGTVVCWEADHSDSEWYRKLNAAMEHAAKLAADLSFDFGSDAMNELIGQLPGFSQYADMMFWIENIAMIVQGITKIRGKVTLDESYEELKGFFVRKLGVKSLTMQMVYNELKESPQSSIDDIKAAILSLNGFLQSDEGKQGHWDPDPIKEAKIFPVGYPNGSLSLSFVGVDFAIAD
ncbi:hypothetical protein KAF25_010481 [Fusarium avenaceum]|uniref:Uncharacterized protein n=1 Tax=Fusarium avenaceum TaxID=40199 RepID=A0A9P7GR92_9HYPO|nr:hypothetical protein KAF25_010481 [Fusarium avenaceum]